MADVRVEMGGRVVVGKEVSVGEAALGGKDGGGIGSSGFARGARAGDEVRRD